MPVLIVCIAGGIAFLLVFLWACMREPNRTGPRYALLLQVRRAAESDRRQAACAGGRR